jgi:hypothetical protein
MEIRVYLNDELDAGGNPLGFLDAPTHEGTFGSAGFGAHITIPAPGTELGHRIVEPHECALTIDCERVVVKTADYDRTWAPTGDEARQLFALQARGYDIGTFGRQLLANFIEVAEIPASAHPRFAF